MNKKRIPNVGNLSGDNDNLGVPYGAPNNVCFKVGHINPKSFVATIDSGSCYNIVDLKTYNKLPADSKLRKDSVTNRALNLRTASGEPLPVLFSSLILCKFDGYFVEIEVLIVQKLSVNFILGLPFLRDTRSVINIASSTLTLFDGVVQLPLEKRCMQIAKLLICENQEIPAGSERWIHVKTNKKWSKNAERNFAISTQESGDYSNCIALAKCLIAPANREIYCRVLNITDQIIPLQKHSILGVATEIDPDDIFLIQEHDDDTLSTGQKDTGQ